jgi:hypothetical protein
MDLKPSDLYKKHDQLVELKKKTYDDIYKRCVTKIKLTAGAGELLCAFEIPHFIFGNGYSIVNVESCANYIMNKLTKTTPYIKTTFIEPNILFIDWRKDQ